MKQISDESIGIYLSGGKKWFKEFHKKHPSKKRVDIRVTHSGVTKDFTYEEVVKKLGLCQAADELEKEPMELPSCMSYPPDAIGIAFEKGKEEGAKPKQKKLERLPLITTEWNLEKKRTAALIIIRLNEIIDYLNTERVEKDAE